MSFFIATLPLSDYFSSLYTLQRHLLSPQEKYKEKKRENGRQSPKCGHIYLYFLLISLFRPCLTNTDEYNYDHKVNIDQTHGGGDNDTEIPGHTAQ